MANNFTIDSIMAGYPLILGDKKKIVVAKIKAPSDYTYQVSKLYAKDLGLNSFDFVKFNEGVEFSNGNLIISGELNDTDGKDLCPVKFIYPKLYQIGISIDDFETFDLANASAVIPQAQLNAIIINSTTIPDQSGTFTISSVIAMEADLPMSIATQNVISAINSVVAIQSVLSGDQSAKYFNIFAIGN